MLTELYGKGGQVCQSAKEGKLRCPLIIRPTSEDVITGEIVQALRCIQPRWWLPQLLNSALGAPRFRQQVYRQLQIELWQNQPAYPRQLLPWGEGSTQVDIVLTWENPRTTVFIEMKYGSDLSSQTANTAEDDGYPTDQLIRNIRVGLWRCGWFREAGLFPDHPRDFVQILLTPEASHVLVARYRQVEELRSAIPTSDRLIGLPRKPFVGELGYQGLIAVLRSNQRWMSRAERTIAGQLIEYLLFKQATKPGQAHSLRQAELASTTRTENSTGQPAMH